MADYEEFRLRFSGPAGGPFVVDATGPGGAGQGEFIAPFNEDQLENFILKLGRSRGGKRKVESPETEAARKFGKTLFDTVMAGKVGEAYRASLAKNPDLRVTVSLGAAPSLMTIPWEFMFDTADFVATSPETPVVRTLDVAQPALPLQIELPLRILVVSCQPADADTINAGLERASLEPALKPLADRNAVVIDWLEHATLGALNEKLYSGDYHVLHFIGHGGFVAGMGEGALVFEDGKGGSDIVGADRFAAIVRARPTIRLVVLNSCEGARSSVDDPFSGVAASLIERRLPAVVGMQFEISDAAAIRFAKYFYAVLAEGKSVDRAVTEARLAMFADRDDVEWGTPVLFMRASDGHLFAIPNAVAIPREILEGPAPPPTKPKADEGSTTPSIVERLRQLPGRVSRKAWYAVGAVAIIVALAMYGGTIARITVRAGNPGQVVITGDRFAAHETVAVTIGSTTVSKEADADGGFVLTFDVPGGGVGVVVAEGQSSKRRATAQFTLPQTSPTPSAPASSASVGPPSIGPSVPASQPASGPPSVPPTALSCFDPVIRQRLIVFYSNFPSGNYHLKCVDPATRQIGNVSIAGGSTLPVQFVSWEPNHLLMVYTRGSAGGPRGRDVLAIDETLRPQSVSVTNDDDWFPVWNRNDDIAFIRSGSPEDTVMLRGKGQGNAEPWFSARQIRSLAWSPDNQYLAFFGKQPDKSDFDIGIIAPGETEPRWVITNDGVDRNPTFSNDGQTILFVRGTGDDSSNDIWTFDLRTQNQTQLTGTDKDEDGPADDGIGVQDGNPVWSPDGTQIAFYRATASGFQIWVMNADGTKPYDLMPDRPDNNLDPNWR
ncbi:MAG TPA: CHAT domain-containing protein [Candidatus Limnocylindrales bacterium]|nr:CHAT domain-containing protein [Candidatus Limnocylindrales bacterium]